MDAYTDIAMFTMDDIADTLGPDFDSEHLCSGLEIVLDYLNDGNEYEKLLLLQSRANLWALEYFDVKQLQPQRADVVLEHHPRLFNLSIPSLLRLDPGCEINPPLDEVDEEDDDTKHPFPAYCEPVLFDDVFLFRILELCDEQLQDEYPADAHHDATTTGGCFPVHLKAMDLRGSPIALYLPCVIANIATMDLSPLDDMPSDDGTDDGFLSSSISSNNTASTASSGQVVESATEQTKPDGTPAKSYSPGMWPALASSLTKLATEFAPRSWITRHSLVNKAILDYESEPEKEAVVEYTDEEMSVDGEVAYTTDEVMTPSDDMDFTMETGDDTDTTVKRVVCRLE
ncbi:hypothetical protein VHEMI01272 [[Torrubiella] hemipterigena]|uniref:Uncharacterized protein n=1 Tax=[Torrubiella] hemipterigena TaxID=1531966 RepID=A0A0A1T4D7_9HYPO|nr:hypothetical protein VHEMI01272 [[Torrubiella] hemipterigena]